MQPVETNNPQRYTPMKRKRLRAKALRTNQQWFTELQPAPNGSKPWVRIFRLESGKFGEPIHGTLAVEELDTSEPFDALSYCCGPPVLDCSITVNGITGFHITENLWDALQRVRKADSDRRLWVDAVCIDQDDEREKSSQVRHMHAVYSRAEEVCIYFGDYADQMRPLIKVNKTCRCGGHVDLDNESRNLQEQMLQFRLPMRAALELIANWCMFQEDTFRDECYRLDLYASEFKATLEETLFGHFGHDASWWKRLWTVQELLLAKHPVIYYGRHVMPWEKLLRIWAKSNNSREELYWLRAMERVSSQMRVEITRLDAIRCQSERNLHALLWATIGKGFTEPKDRIIALLGALSQGALSLDYGLDILVIFASAAIHCIATQNTFGILFSQWGRKYLICSEPQRLHSFVPDFGQSLGTLSRTWETPCLMRLEQGRWESARVPTLPDLFSSVCPRRNEGVFVLRSGEIGMEVIENAALQRRVAFNGASITIVSQLYRLGQHSLDWVLTEFTKSSSRYFAGSLCEGNMHWTVSTTDQLEQHAYDIYALLLESYSLHLDGNPELFVDLKFEAQRRRENPWPIRKINHDPEECLEFLAIADECLRRPWNKCLTGPLASRRHDWTANRHLDFPKYIDEVHEVLQALLLAVVKHKTWSGTFFITSDGHLGIGPESTQPGDQIVVLDGARSPFVLRNLEDSTDYALLGDSFVLGLMHGEVREMDARGQLESRQIVIR